MNHNRHTSLLIALLAILWLAACGNDPANADAAAVPTTGDANLDALNERIAKDPENGDLYATRAEFFYEKNSYDQAVLDMTRALTLDSLNLGHHHLLADIYLDYFRSRLALQTMERAVAIAPNDIPSLLKLSEIQLFLKLNQSSLTSIDKVLRQDPQNALAFFFMGKNFEELGDINRAINAYQESTENDPKMLDAWIKLGQLHAAINGSMAEAFFNTAIEVDSTSTTALNAKAEYRWDQDDPRGALDLYKKAILKDPAEEKSYYNAGLVYMELDSLDKAYQHFDMAVQNAPLYVGAYYYRGYAAEMKGNAEQAKKDYQHVLRLAPEHKRAAEGMARLK